MGVPRPAIHLREHPDGVRLIETKGTADHTGAMQEFTSRILPELAHLRGYILMAKSPSCGMERIKVYNPESQVVRRDGQGMFAKALMRAYPVLPVEEEGRLNDDALRENFIERVFAYDDWMQNVAGENLSAKALIEFHTRHKFQLLAHSEKIYRQLGQGTGGLPAPATVPEPLSGRIGAQEQGLTPCVRAQKPYSSVIAVSVSVEFLPAGASDTCFTR